MRLSEVAAIVQGRLQGDPGADIRGVARIEEAGEGQITFLANPKYRKHLATTRATAVLVSDSPDPGDTTGQARAPGSGATAFIAVRDPYASFMALLDLFHPAPARPAPGVDPTASVSSSAKLGVGVSVGANAVVGDNCVVGDRTIVSHGAILGAFVTVGEDSHLMENVVVKSACRIGRRVTLHPGAVIGSDGFGWAPGSDGKYDKIPQRGIVVLEDDVDVGANTTIDRATIGETRICRGVKLDNLIQIGHNVRIGDDTVIVAQTGIAGSTRIGRQCVIAGQVGIVGHLTIGDRTTLGAQAGISKSLEGGGKVYSSSPALEHRRALRIEAALRQLPELLAEVRALREELDRLTGPAPTTQTPTGDNRPL